MSEDFVSLVGTLEKILYTNPENGFLIGTFITENSIRPITVKGIVFNTHEHETLRLKGSWENHKTYGRQFSIREFMPVEPTSEEGIIRYLSSEVFKGIGKITAERIVKKFGKDTFKIIDSSPKLLSKVKGVGRKQQKSLLDAWDAQRGLRDVMTFLRGVGISHAYAQRIFVKNGLNSIPLIKANPYQLTDIPGIGFLTADGIARNLGFDNNSPHRADAGLLYMLEQQALNGHTCFPRRDLLEKTVQELNIDSSMLESSIRQLLEDRLLNSDKIEDASGNEQELVSRPRFYKAERRVAENIFRILNSEAYTVYEGESYLIEEQELKVGLKLDPAQREAVEAALQHKVLIITGGPGTGKTTIVRFILGLMRTRIPAIALAAPTGRAAKRITETTGAAASTIHRLLEASNIGFKRDRENPLEQELLILDETSMIDTLLMDSLLEAVPSASRLILVGDVDQLPSVGAGAVLSDLIESGLIPVVRLDHIFRQAADSFITVNAHKVRRGEMPDFSSSNRQTEDDNQLLDFYFIKESNPEKIVEKILLMSTERIPQRFELDPMMDIQVLTPMHRGVTGAINLNRKLQDVINPDAKGLEHLEQWFRIGDKVMQQQNDYEKLVFNGDLGRIVNCDPKTKELHVKFDQQIVHYQGKEIDQLSLAYAITVHKSQGSEYSAVIVPLTTHHYMMLQRNLLYTAITRGKQLVVLIGTDAAIKKAVENEGSTRRFTGLLHQLSELGAAPLF
ncbi:MAG: ATP-dependent RecD-like DNA helicase [SAR324 cluster bacterium]|jgi:exodeoxyribonuclease V alpha subunit|nr:ATP-dependent RecD-like DNA helicase [SAR324 cluster bacterium]|tara:strand:+ start:797 stop:3004 length:2208 start_codon:yes stop_codon:yes gene_type:complete